MALTIGGYTMMTKLKSRRIFLWLVLFGLAGCMDFDEYDNDPKGNFEALWTIMDEHYCFFTSKNIDWNAAHDRYAPRVSADMGQEALFYLLNDMLKEVRDGHVNLASSFDVGRYDAWYYDSIENFNLKLIEDKYLGRDYLVASGLKYKVLDDNVGYIYYSSFSNNIGEGNLDHVIKKFESCHGIVIDVRDNGGGALTNVDILASRFTNEKVLVGYILHKRGVGHNDFSEPYPRYLDSSTRLRFQKPVVVLTNRKTYSAANEFASVMKQLPNVRLMGSTTGGGGGLPFSSELPNGWSVRFSASPMLDPDMKDIEEGVTPHYYIGMDDEKLPSATQDDVIEAARAYIKMQEGFVCD